jgi:aminoglycoside phosphotransferase family enzyme/predicted kinase
MLEKLLTDLSSPDAYPHPVDSVRIAQTHISCVFLTGRYVYKVKKPVRFAFLDYSTIEKRRAMCLREVELNRRLCPSVYLDVVPVVEDNGRFRIGGAGRHVDWAVKMIELREADMLPVRLKQRQISGSEIERIAEALSSFHRNAATSPEIDEFGSVDKISLNAEENFQETESRADDILPADHLRAIETYTRDFLAMNEDLFRARVEKRWVRDGHGDLRVQNICLQPELESGVQIFDCIEFNDRLRFLDVASDIAYLAMDLDLAGRADLRSALLRKYTSGLQDTVNDKLFRFYCCYRAYVRGKIALFASEETEIPDIERSEHSDIARAALDLSRSYAKHFSRPVLIMMMGFSGSGKSWLAQQLARRLPAVVLSTDILRKELASATPEMRLASEWYTAEKISKVYDSIRQAGAGWLEKGEHVILDGTFLSRAEREKATAIAARMGADFWIVQCVCPDSVIRERIRNRPAGYSDADLAVYEAQRKMFDPLTEPATVHQANRNVSVDTSRPAALVAREILNP